MITDTAINQYIESAMIAENDKRAAEHEPSGKLSASMLYQPLRFQVLKTLGAPRRELDPYVLGKFKRGNDVEDWYVSQLDGMGVLVESQKRVEYRGAVGIVDAMVDHSFDDGREYNMQLEAGVIPHEVKSVTNAKLKRLKKTGVDFHYQIQACFYALALGSEYYSVDIVSAEDLQQYVYIFRTDKMSGEVDRAVGNYLKAMERWAANRELPKFAGHPSVPWTSNPNYAMFDTFWFEAPDSAVIKKLEKLELV